MLLNVCVAEFRRAGFARTDVASIVKQAGVSRGTFYFHFPSKDDVLIELRLREERRIYEQTSARGGDVSLEGALRDLVEGILEAEDRLGPDLVREMCAVQFRRPEVVNGETLAEHPVGELVVSAITRHWKDESGARSVRDPGDLTYLFLIGLFGLLSAGDGPSTDRDRLIAALISLTAQGVKPS